MNTSAALAKTVAANSAGGRRTVGWAAAVAVLMDRNGP
jgi:hypothetical protein